jgi:dTDP-glucose 4,6-dehydratase
MKIIVTGGAGFIGSNFILYWMKKYPNDEIFNLDKLTYAGNLENLVEVEKNPHYHFIKVDICDPGKIFEVFKNIDTVVHFAAESHVDRSILDPSVFVKTNVLGTQILLEASLKAQIKHFHHVSTDEVFGSLTLESTAKFNENTNYGPRSPYAASKAASDHLVRAYYHTYGLPITITNCSNNYGPYQFPEKFIPLAITNILENKKVPVYGDGMYERDWLYVEDHCSAIDQVIKLGKIGETYCVGGTEENISNLDIVRRIIKIMGKDESIIEYVKDRPGHDRRYAIDYSKIKKELKWQPRSNIDEYLNYTVNWYIKNENWWKEIKSGEYQDYYKKLYGEKS